MFKRSLFMLLTAGVLIGVAQTFGMTEAPEAIEPCQLFPSCLLTPETTVIPATIPVRLTPETTVLPVTPITKN